MCWTCTCVGAAGDAGVLHVVTVVLLPLAMRTLIQEELVSGALHSIQQDRTGTLTKVSPGPGLGHTPTTHTRTRTHTVHLSRDIMWIPFGKFLMLVN